MRATQDPPQQVIDDCTKEVDEALRQAQTKNLIVTNLTLSNILSLYRVLSKGGLFIYLTFGQPHFRRRFLTRPGTTLEIKELGESFHYYLYIMRTHP
jgi:EEF1A lysine methyltransferase 4